jgi:hypothetical protein
MSSGHDRLRSAVLVSAQLWHGEHKDNIAPLPDGQRRSGPTRVLLGAPKALSIPGLGDQAANRSNHVLALGSPSEDVADHMDPHMTPGRGLRRLLGDLAVGHADTLEVGLETG